MSVVDCFLENPSEDQLEEFTKEQLIELAGAYQIELSSADKRHKDVIKEKLKVSLAELEVYLPVMEKLPTPYDILLEIRLKELVLREKELEFERERLQVKLRERELELKLEMRKLTKDVVSYHLKYQCCLELDNCAKNFPEVFPTCAVTYAMAEQSTLGSNIDLTNTFMIDPEKFCSGLPSTSLRQEVAGKIKPEVLSPSKLIAAQSSEPSFKSLFGL
ncbi:hypothetical protein IRJ41_003412, partial [Triplophysa rosa]